MAISCSEKPPKEVNCVERLFIHEELKNLYIEDIHKNKYILDTGAEASLLFDSTFFKENIFSKIGIDRIKINEHKIANRAGTNILIQFKTFTLEGERFIFVPHNVLSASDNTIKGLIGMDILSKNNTYWNISDGEFILNYDSISAVQPKLTLKYEKEKLPTTKISINSVQIDNIILDTGHNLAIVLPIEFISKYEIDENTLLKGQMSDLFCAYNQSLYYKTDTLSINNNLLQFHESIPFVFGDFNKNTAILGLTFFKYWDYFIINVSSKEIQFYKDDYK